jgi:putative tricarboxylic transport membrane protein
VSSGADTTLPRRVQATLPYLVVLAAGIFLYHETDTFQFEQSAGRIGPGAWPKLILLMMLVTALWGVVSSFLRTGRSAPEQSAEAEEAEELVRPPEIYPYRVWLAVAATVGYLILLPIIGFFLATIAYSFILMYLGDYRRPVPVVLLSLAIGLFFMFMFMRVVYVALPLGVAPFDKVSYALMTAMGVH